MLYVFTLTGVLRAVVFSSGLFVDMCAVLSSVILSNLLQMLYVFTLAGEIWRSVFFLVRLYIFVLLYLLLYSQSYYNCSMSALLVYNIANGRFCDVSYFWLFILRVWCVCIFHVICQFI